MAVEETASVASGTTEKAQAWAGDDFERQFARQAEAARAQLPAMNAAQADYLFEQYVRQQQAVLAKLMEREAGFLDDYMNARNWQEAPDGSVQPSESLLLQQQFLAQFGLEYWDIGEGLAIIRPHADHYWRLFGGYVSPDYRDYLRIQARQEQELAVSDAAVGLLWSELGRRIIEGEQFLQTHPGSRLAEQVRRDWLHVYQNWFFLGLDNTPVFLDDGSQPYPEYRQAWLQLAKDYPNSQTAAIVRRVAALNQEQTKQVLREYGLGDEE